MYSTTSYGGRPSLHSRPMSTDTRASGTSSSGGTELMMDIMAGQASVDVRDCMWKIMSWDEVEDAKKVRRVPLPFFCSPNKRSDSIFPTSDHLRNSSCSRIAFRV